MRKGSIKNNRVSGEVKKALSEIIRDEVKDPRIAKVVSVTEAYVAPDLKTCKAYISVLGDKEALDKTIEGLNSASGYIRRELARKVNLRNTPEITFIADESIAYGAHMTHKIDELVAQIPEREETDELIAQIPEREEDSEET